MRGRRGGFLPPDAGCWLFVVTAPLIAGAILTFSVGMTKGGGDYCDPIYTSVAERDADYRAASLSIVISSLVMLVHGVAAVAVLIVRRHSIERWRGVRVGLGIVGAAVAMTGYLFLLLIVSDLSSDCGGIRL